MKNYEGGEHKSNMKVPGSVHGSYAAGAALVVAVDLAWQVVGGG